MHTHLDFEHPNMAHGFFTRASGVSTGVYDSLNCGFGSEDSPDSVAQNRAIVANQIGVTPEHLLGPYQVHGSEVITITEPFTERPKADALVTNTPGLALSVLTADCAPVLFHAGGVIGAAHAGWKGALSGVLDNTIAAMKALGATNITACIGPCIAQDSYEVSPEFPDPFIAENPQSAQFFNANHFDLSGYCAWRIQRAGAQPHIIAKDTYANETDFFSYRRTTHRRENDYGRQISVITLQNGT